MLEGKPGSRSKTRGGGASAPVAPAMAEHTAAHGLIPPEARSGPVVREGALEEALDQEDGALMPSHVVVETEEHKR
jgi:hypothetical protein